MTIQNGDDEASKIELNKNTISSETSSDYDYSFLQRQFPSRRKTKKSIKVAQEFNPSAYQTPIAATKRNSKKEPKLVGILKRDSEYNESSKPKSSKIEGDISPTIYNVPKYIERRMQKNGKRIMNINDDKLHQRIEQEENNPKKKKAPLANSSQEYVNNSNKYITPMHKHPNNITSENLLISDSMPININTVDKIPSYAKKEAANFIQPMFSPKKKTCKTMTGGDAVSTGYSRKNVVMIRNQYD